MLDWDKNVDPEFGKHNKLFPKPVRPEAGMAEAGYREMWVCYGRPILFGQGTDRLSGPLRDDHAMRLPTA